MPKTKSAKTLSAMARGIRNTPRKTQHTNQSTGMTKKCIPKPIPKQLKTSKSSSSQHTEEYCRTLIDCLTREYKKAANPKNAAAQKGYMRDQFEFYGLKAPERRAIDKQVIVTTPKPDVQSLHLLLQLLWQQPQREYQQFGLDFGNKYISVLIGSDYNTCVESLELTKSLICTLSWWDTVDMLAIKFVGALVKSHRESLVATMDEWISSENMWLRRTALLHQLFYKADTDSQLLFRYCKLCCHEEEFFIRKAIGWALRQYSKVNKADVKDFIDTNKNKLSTLSIREGSKYL